MFLRAWCSAFLAMATIGDLDPEEFRAKAVKIMETLGCDTASIKQNSNPVLI